MKPLIRFSVLIGLLLAALPIYAQETTAVDPEALVIAEGWELVPAAEYNSDFADIPNLDATIVAADKDGLWTLIMTPEQVEMLLEGVVFTEGEALTETETLIGVYNRLYGYEISADEIGSERVSGSTIWGWHYLYGEGDEAGRGEAHVIPDPVGGFYFTDTYAQPKALETSRAEVDDLLISVTVLAGQTSVVDPLAGTELAVPEGWDAVVSKKYNDFFAGVPNLDAMVLSNGAITSLVLTPEQVDLLLDGVEIPEDADELLFTIYKQIFDFEIFSDGIVGRRVGGVDTRAYFYTYGDEENPGEGEAYLFPAADGGWYFTDIYGANGESDPVAEDLDTILNSMAALAAAR